MILPLISDGGVPPLELGGADSNVGNGIYEGAGGTHRR